MVSTTDFNQVLKWYFCFNLNDEDKSFSETVSVISTVLPSWLGLWSLIRKQQTQITQCLYLITSLIYAQ